MKLSANRSLFIAALLVVLWALPGSCAPAEPKLQRNVYRILSESSGKHVGVTRGGRVHAHANHPSKFDTITFVANVNGYLPFSVARRTLFYPSSNPIDGTMKFESVKFRGRYLILDENKGRIRLGEAQNGNEKFIIEKINPLFYVMKPANRVDCFMAFDEEGELVDPCSVSETDLETRIFLDIYD